MPSHAPRYLVQVLGFSTTERALLTRTFAMSSHSSPRFEQLELLISPEGRADVFLVDLSDGLAIGEFLSLNCRELLPAVLVASAGGEGGAGVLQRPLESVRVIKALRDAIEGAADAAPAPLDAGRRDLPEITSPRQSSRETDAYAYAARPQRRPI